MRFPQTRNRCRMYLSGIHLIKSLRRKETNDILGKEAAFILHPNIKTIKVSVKQIQSIAFKTLNNYILILILVFSISIMVSIFVSILIPIAPIYTICSIQQNGQVLIFLIRIRLLNNRQHGAIKQSSTNHKQRHINLFVDNIGICNNLNRGQSINI